MESNLNLVDSLSAELIDEAFLSVQSFLTAFVNNEAFSTNINLTFGNLIGTEILESLRQQWNLGDFEELPRIEIRSASEINGANGAFASTTNTIYLSSEYISQNATNPRVITNVLLEEIGHYIDSKINLIDALGDEGAIFSALVQRGSLSTVSLNSLKAENDHAVINLNGEAIAIEQNESSIVNLDAVVNGLTGANGLFAKIQTTIQNQVFGNESQVFGNNLPLPLLDSINDSFLSNLSNVIAAKLGQISNPNPTAGEIKQQLQQALNEAGLQQSTIEVLSDGSFVLTLNKAADTNSFAADISNNLGLPNLGLTLDGQANVELGYDLKLQFGVDNNGFYFDTSTDELKLNLNAGITNFTGSAKLGTLDITLNDAAPNVDELSGIFTIDLKDADGRLTSAESLSADASLKGSLNNKFADINLGIKTQFGVEILPEISTVFNLSWAFDNQTFANVSAPVIAFNDVTIGTSSFTSFIDPVFKNINKLLAPVRPLVKALQTEIDLGVTKLSLLDIAQKFPSPSDPYIDETDAAFIKSIDDFFNVFDRLKGAVDPNGINLGNINFGSLDIRDSALKNTVLPQTNSIFSLGDLTESGLKLPILTELNSVFNLLLGKDADLFEYDLPSLDFTVDYSQFFPSPIPVLGVEVRGIFGASANLGFGLDTKGLFNAEGGLATNPSSSFDGLFIKDIKDGIDKPEFTINAGLEAYGAVNAAVASVGVGGGLYANVDFNLKNSDDGKIRVSNLLNGDLLCLFDTSGSLTAGINAFARLGGGLFTLYEQRFESPRLTLLNFDIPADCPPSEGKGTPLNPVLASKNGSAIGINSGRKAVKQAGIVPGGNNGGGGDGGDGGDGGNPGQDPNNDFDIATDLGLVPFIDPNNALVSPNDISPTPPKTLTNRVGFNEDFGLDTDDYYKFRLSQPGDLSISISGMSKDADLEIYDSDFDQIGSSTRGGASADTVHIKALATGTYYARVLAFASEGEANSTNYKISAIASPTTGSYSSPAQGFFVEDDKRSFADSSVVRVSSRGSVRGSFDANDGVTVNDYYQFTLEEGIDAVQISVSYLFAGSSQADFQVFNSAFERIGQASINNADRDSITLTNLVPGDTYYIHVYPEDGSSAGSNVYNLSVSPLLNFRTNSVSVEDENVFIEDNTASQFNLNPEFREPVATQSPNKTSTVVSEEQPSSNFLFLSTSIPEPGNTKETAADLGTLTNITPINKILTGADDKDYYRFTVNQDGEVNFLLDFGLAVNDATLTPDQLAKLLPNIELSGENLKDEQGNPTVLKGNIILQTFPQADNNDQRQIQKSISLNLKAGEYYVQVSKSDEQTADINYNLTLANAADLGTVTNIYSYEGELGGTAAQQEKLYRFTVNTNSSFGLSLGKASNQANPTQLDPLDADLDVEMLRSDGTVIQSSAIAGNSPESIAIDQLEPGTYYIRVQPNNPQTSQVTYDLILASLSHDESFRIEQTPEKIIVTRDEYGYGLQRDSDGNPLPDGTPTYRQEFDSATTITADGDQGDDIFRVINVSAPVQLNGNEGNDQIQGGSSNDLLTGGEGEDFIQGKAGNDTLQGNQGDDLIQGDAGADFIDGGEHRDKGGDTAIYTDSNAGVNVSLVSNTGSGGDAEGDSLSGIENLAGSNNADILTGDTANNIFNGWGGNDSIGGGSGDDVLIGGAGGDILDGGDHSDTVFYITSQAGVSVDFSTGNTLGGDAVGDTFSSIENIGGSNFNDILLGNAGSNKLEGSNGNDILDGSSGSDVLVGGDGNDNLKGNTGDDVLEGGAGNDILLGDTLGSVFTFAQRLRFIGLANNLNQSGINETDVRVLLFDENFYLSENPDVAAAVSSGAFRSGFEHFIQSGQFEGRDPSILYNESFYLSQNPDVAAAVNIGALRTGFEHFIQSGQFEGRDPSSSFSNSLYLLQNPDVAAAVSSGALRTGFEHFIQSGQFEGRDSDLLFNEGFYLSQNSDVAAAVSSGALHTGFEHFIQSGQFEGRDPSILYDESFYLSQNQDVAAAVSSGALRSGFEHFIQSGQQENRASVLGGSDRLEGNNGDDILYGGTGGILTGGDGTDQFWIANKILPTSVNTVADFQVGVDAIAITGFHGLTSISNLTLTQQGADTLINYSGKDLAMLTGIQASSLDNSTFIFT